MMSGDNTITTRDWDVSLMGLGRDDLLIGGEGCNVFSGGSGADHFDGVAGIYRADYS